MLTSLEGYVNALREEGEYITPFPSTIFTLSLSLFFFLSP